MTKIHKDCFGYKNSSDNGCLVLKRLYCKSEKCKFYKLDRDGKYPHQILNKDNKEIEI